MNTRTQQWQTWLCRSLLGLLLHTANLAHSQCILYGVTSAGDLITINPTTGAGTLVGHTGFNLLDTVELRSDGNLVAIDGSGPAGGSRLIRINPVTGAGSLIRDVSEFAYIEGLAFGDGKLYAAVDSQHDGGADRLVVLDPFTGIPTTNIGSFGLNAPAIDDVDGLAISPAGELYGTDLLNKRLLRINPTTGAGTHIAFLSEWVAGLDFSDDGRLFGTTMSSIAAAGGASRLVTINTTNGAITDIGAVGYSNVWGIVFFSMPQPVSLSITKSGDGVSLRWPASAASYVLETTSHLDLSHPWEAVTNTIGVDGGMFSVTNSTEGQSRFFRLRWRCP